ncbi:MAG: glycosyltransferase family 4 protein [Vicinamibacterales bacterium]
MTPAPGGRRVRVAVVARVVYPLHGHGGLQRHVHDLVRFLAARSVDVTLITQPPMHGHLDDPDANEMLTRPGIRILTVPYRTFPLANRRGTTILDRITAYPLFGERAGALAAKLAADGSIDVVHGLGAAVLGYARRWPGPDRRPAPLVFNPQGLEEFGATDPSHARLKRLAYRPLQWAVRTCARAADRVVATDRVLVRPVLQHLRVPPEAVVTIPNAIDLDDCDRPADERAADLRRSTGLGPADPLLVSVGRLEANKGFHILVDALTHPTLRDVLGVNWRWVVVGDGPMRGRLEQRVAAAGLGARVVFAGRASGDDLHGWLQAATLFVHPTLYEGSSLVTLEAMAHRRAVVGTRAGGLPDKIVPGVTGWLVEPGDPAALAAAIAEALGTPDRLPAMGDAGRALVEREFSWPAVADRHVALYDELLARLRA